MTLDYVDTLDILIGEIVSDNDIPAFVVTAQGSTSFSVGMNLKELLPGAEQAVLTAD